MMEPLYVPEDAVEPPDVRVTELRAEPWPDGGRVRVHLALTPFVKPPSLRVQIFSQNGQDEIASTRIIETIQNRLVFTMHIRGYEAGAGYQLAAAVYYEELGDVDTRQTDFSLPE